MNIILLFLWHLTVCLRTEAAGTSHANDTDLSDSYSSENDNGDNGYYPTWSYVTEPKITSPKTNWLQWDPECDDGLFYFITPRGWGIEKPGPMILDWKGDLVWTEHFKNEFGGQAYDFKVQHYQGRNYLTFWTGDDRVRGHGAGSYLMLNSSYNVVHKVNAANGLQADLHEFLITNEGTALMTIYQKYQYDVSSFREFDAENDANDAEANWIWDCIFQELAIDTNELIFEWRASDHINISDTYHDIYHTGNHEDPFDWFHINSVQKDELGNYLISARYTHSLTYIDGMSGDIIWTLGGRSNDFMDLSDGFAVNFAWQHDARFLAVDEIPNLYQPPEEQEGYTTALVTLFDNAAEDHNYAFGMDLSRGLLLEITYPTPASNDENFVRGSTELRDISHLRELAAHTNPYSGRSVRRQDDDDAEPSPDDVKIAAINGSSPSYTVRVIQSYENPDGVRSSSQGSVQMLSQGAGQDPKVFVGYGLNAVFTEFSSNGTVLCNAHYGAVSSWERGDIQSYRAYKFAWSGWPMRRPKIDLSDDEDEIYVSWNGATEIAEWILQGSETEDGGDDAAWTDIARQPKDGFEAVFELDGSDVGTLRYIRAVAVGSDGRILPHGNSKVLDRGYLASFFPDMSEHLPEQVADAPLSRIFWCIVIVVVGGFVLFEAGRLYLSWRAGRPASGVLMWRTSGGYRLLSEARLRVLEVS